MSPRRPYIPAMLLVLWLLVPSSSSAMPPSPPDGSTITERPLRPRWSDNFAFALAGLSIGVLLYAMISAQKRERRHHLEHSVSSMQLKELCNELRGTLAERTHELELANERVNEAERIKNAFLTNISHEIRTPLNGILGFSRLLLQGDITQHDRERYGKSIEQQGGHLTRLLNDLLLLSKFDTNQFTPTSRPCNLNQLIDALYGEYYRAEAVVSKHLQLLPVKPLSDHEASFNTDPDSIKRILQAAIENSIKFTHTGYVEFGYMLSNHKTLMFFVKDTGMGIPKEMQQRVFDRFFRYTSNNANQLYEGMGLGLTIAKGLAHAMGGHIDMQSEVEEGTTLHLTLPQVQLSAPSHRNLGGRKVLLIDNHVADSLYLSKQLEQAGVRTINLKSIDDAVEVSGLLLDLDAALLNWQLPFTRGDEAVIQLRALNPKLPLVAIVPTHSTPTPDPIWSGCQGMLARDANPSMLFDMLENIFEGQSQPQQ